MSQLQLLWQYQGADVEADRFEAEMRAAPNRQKLLRHRNFLMEQQNNIKQIETDVADMADRLEAVKDDMARLEKLLADQQALDIDSLHDLGLDETQKHLLALQKLLDSFTRYEQELQHVTRESAVFDQQQKEIRMRSAKVKTEFDQIKAVYDVEVKEQTVKLNELRAAAEQLTAGIDAALLDKYKAIKLHASPPMAILTGDRCGGCRMSLPSVVLREIRLGTKIVECDNCGRILMVITEE